MAMALLISLAFCGNLMVSTHANEFLKATHGTSEHISEQDVRTSLLDEVESSLGKGSATGRLSQMEATLSPIIAALPKNEYGNLGHSGVGYALHRLFVLRHGWVLHGLHSDGSTGNSSSSPSGLLTDQVPSYIEGLFEQRLAGRGFGLHEVAVLAATIEHLIHNEAVSKLGAAFNVHSLPVMSPISEIDAARVLDTYMMAYIVGESLDNMTLDYVQTTVKEMPEIFLAWRDTQEFVHNIRKNVTTEVGVTDYASLAKAAEVVGEQFGSFQDFECKQMKDKLVAMEYRGTGRVKISDFYKPALSGSWTFTESLAYLRSQGILDESDSEHPSVMIANYVTSHGNCIASSGFYSVCCKNECEGLLGHIEQNIGTYEAKPETIVDLVANLPSSSVSAPQTLPASLLERLHGIAAAHGGSVPLHSRLFAQFMHHVYPRECPYPHVSGTTDAKVAEVWAAESGNDVTASEEEMNQYVALSGAERLETLSSVAVEEVMEWSHEEELLVNTDAGAAILRRVWQPPASLRSVMLLTASCSLAFSMIQTMKIGSAAVSPEKKYTV